MIKLAIVDNDVNNVEKLKSIIDNFYGKTEYSVKVFSSAMEFVSDTLTPPPPEKSGCDKDDIEFDGRSPFYDIVFMEADFPHFDGLSAAKKLREHDSGFFLVIVSKSDKYAVEAYSVETKDYILKPVGSQRVEACLAKASAFIHSRENGRRLLLSVDGELRRILTADIKFIEVNGHFLKYHLTGGEEIITRGKLDNAEEMLKDCGFFRIYKCYLVNLDQVDSVRLNCVIIGNERLLISRFRKKEFIEALKKRIISS